MKDFGVHVIMSTFNKSGTPLRVMGNTSTTSGRCGIRVALTNGGPVVRGIVGRGGLGFCNRLVVVRARSIVSVRSRPADLLGTRGRSSVTLTFGRLDRSETSTFISTNSANTIIINNAFVIGEVGNVGHPTLTNVVPSPSNRCVLLSVNTGTRYHPRVLYRFNVVTSTCLGNIRNGRGTAVNLLGVNARSSGNNRLRGRTCGLLGTTPVGFINGIRSHRVPGNIISTIIASKFANGVTLGLVRNATVAFFGLIGGTLCGDLGGGLTTLIVGGSLCSLGDVVSDSRINKTPLLNIEGPIVGTRNGDSTGTFGGTVERTMLFARGGMVRGVAGSLARMARWEVFRG